MRHYLNGRTPKIKTVDNIKALKSKEVCTIGYPADQGFSYQIKHYGKVATEASGAIATSIKPYNCGRSVAGLSLKESEELIGTLYGNDTARQTQFAPIVSEIKTWIETNK